MNRKVQEAYRSREAADEYQARHGQGRNRRMVTRREAGLIEKLIKGVPVDGVVLDAACGTGRLLSCLRAAGRRIVGIDSSMEMILKGTETGSIQPGTAVAASVFMLPLTDNAVDACICCRFFHHLGDREERAALIAELCRVTSGPVVISFWGGFNIQWMRRRIKALFGRRASARHTIGVKGFKRELEACGFEIKIHEYLARFVSETEYVCVGPRGLENKRT